MQLCPDCNIELDPNVHRFCYGCGKTIQEIVSNAREEDNNGIQLCPNCNVELDTNVHMFCYKCGKKVQDMVSNVQKKQDTTLSHTPVPECDSSEQISNSGIDVASNIKEVKQPVIVETTVAETQGSQQVTAVTGQMPVSKAKSQAGNGNELNESDAGHTVSGSAEQTSNSVIVDENEIDTESVQTSPASPEKMIADDQNSIGKGHECGETGSMDIDSTVQVPNKSLILNNPDFSHDKNVSGVSQISNSGSEQQVVVGDRESAVGEIVGKGFKRLTAVSKKTYANETKSLKEATWQGGNRNQPIVSDAGHPMYGSPEQVSDHVIFIANEFGEITVAQETAVVEPLAGSVQKSPTSPEKMTVGDQNSIGKANEVGETGSTDIDRHIPKKDLILNNDPNLPRYDENVNGRSFNEISDINHGECAGKLTNNSDPGTKEHKPSSQELTEVVDTFDEFAEGILTAGKRNVDHEQRTPELVQHSEEKKDSEKGKSEDKGGKDELKIENDVTRNNSGISDANGDGSKVDKMVGGNLKTTTAGNRQQIAKDDKDQTVTSNKSKTNKDNVSSDMRRSTRSIKPQQPGGVQDRVSQKDETLLEKAKQVSSHPSSHGNETATPADEGNRDGYFYKKEEVTQEQGKKSKKKGKGKDDKHPTDSVDEQSLTVVFHAILSDKFKLDEGMNIVIRGDSPVFDGWNKGGVDVTTQ
ncbi:Hypothetical predicted protein [Paramuricea clavata]|uniref:Uncharacterized protein n=1 Tax=Paramuricea clavata TaxID=317549 RepID=A0A7D9KWX6_PARCT|nr:Hypothetical predicted protein [Paramuricea clavata]